MFVGYPLFFRRVSKFLIFFSKVKWEEFVLRSLSWRLVDGTSRNSRIESSLSVCGMFARQGLIPCGICCLCCLCKLSVSEISARKLDCLTETVCLANKFFYFTRAYVPQREHVVNKPFPHLWFVFASVWVFLSLVWPWRCLQTPQPILFPWLFHEFLDSLFHWIGMSFLVELDRGISLRNLVGMEGFLCGRILRMLGHTVQIPSSCGMFV